ncbi:hypothetical protein VB779_03245 [Haloarculaceae archaeon H-GB11]|nr:hypothetical protein [Haloarculaceae archaeon H-GB11]
MSQLYDYGLVTRVGPNENLGLYEITERGRAALALREQYGEDEDFEELIEEYIQKSTN